MLYEIVYSIDGESYSCIKRNNPDDSISWIPIDNANSDYQAYLAWLAAEQTEGSV